jgi:hypothetical protein
MDGKDALAARFTSTNAVLAALIYAITDVGALT